MSHVEPFVIDEIRVNLIPLERTIDSDTVDDRVRDEFLKRKYQDLPRSQDEAKARGMSKWSGLMSSFPEVRTYKVSPGRVIVSADILPTRYHVGEAFRNYKDRQEEERLTATPANLLYAFRRLIRGPGLRTIQDLARIHSHKETRWPKRRRDPKPKQRRARTRRTTRRRSDACSGSSPSRPSTRSPCAMGN